jgi:hypothetical protein
MLDSDFATFEDAFKRLSGGLNRKWPTREFRATVQIYFDALKVADLADVLSAETTLRNRGRWPKVSDWLAALPVKAHAFSSDRIMRTAEVDVYMDALRRHYHGDPCSCLLCQDADVTDLPQRFVPDFTPEDVEERAFCPALNRVVVVGHWAHGYELRRWYAAKDKFAHSVPRKFRRLLELVQVPTREPGEDG